MLNMNNIENTVLYPIGQFINIYLEDSYGLKLVPHPDESGKEFTLKDVYEQYKSRATMIYVFCDDGRSGEIFRCGNYGAGMWQKYATTRGYA